jgi:F0F1-type ATP synthase membrane subunit b/b'
MEIMGREFRIVNKGLDPDEVVEFLKAATASSDDAFQRLEQFSALEAVTKTMEESITQAKRLAENAKRQAEAEARQEKDRTIKEARQQARAMVDQARESCTALIDDVRSVLSGSINKAFEQARETVSSNLTDLDGNLKKIITSQNNHSPVESEQPDKEPSVATTGSSEDTENGEGEEDEEESEDDPALDLADLQQSLMDLENSLTSLHNSRGGVETEPEFHSSEEDFEDRAELPDAEAAADEPYDDNHRYSGEVMLTIPAGADESWMQELRQRTLELPGAHIRAESGVDEKTTVVTLSLDEPVILLPILRSMPKVNRVVEDQAKEESSAKSRFNLLQKVPKKVKQQTITIELDMDSYNVPVLL